MEESHNLQNLLVLREMDALKPQSEILRAEPLTVEEPIRSISIVQANLYRLNSLLMDVRRRHFWRNFLLVVFPLKTTAESDVLCQF